MLHNFFNNLFLWDGVLEIKGRFKDNFWKIQRIVIFNKGSNWNTFWVIKTPKLCKQNCTKEGHRASSVLCSMCSMQLRHTVLSIFTWWGPKNPNCSWSHVYQCGPCVNKCHREFGWTKSEGEVRAFHCSKQGIAVVAHIKSALTAFLWALPIHFLLLRNNNCNTVVRSTSCRFDFPRSWPTEVQVRRSGDMSDPDVTNQTLCSTFQHVH